MHTCGVVLWTVELGRVDKEELRQLEIFVDVDRFVKPREVHRVHRVADYIHRTQSASQRQRGLLILRKLTTALTERPCSYSYRCETTGGSRLRRQTKYD